MTAGLPLARSTARRRSSTVSPRGWTMSSNSWSGNWASSAWTSRFAVAPVASEITWSSTVAIGRSVAPAQNEHGPVPGTEPCLSGRGPELLRGLGPRAELDGDVLLVRSAADLQLQLVAGLAGVDRLAKLVAGLDALAFDLDHQVAGAQTALGRRAVGDEALELGRAVIRESDAEVRMLDLAVGDQLGCYTLRGVTGHAVVSVVERGIGLNRVLDREAVG